LVKGRRCRRNRGKKELQGRPERGEKKDLGKRKKSRTRFAGKRESKNEQNDTTLFHWVEKKGRLKEKRGGLMMLKKHALYGNQDQRGGIKKSR